MIHKNILANICGLTTKPASNFVLIAVTCCSCPLAEGQESRGTDHLNAHLIILKLSFSLILGGVLELRAVEEVLSFQNKKTANGTGISGHLTEVWEHLCDGLVPSISICFFKFKQTYK